MSSTLLVDFSWKNFKARVTEKDDPESKDLYIIDFKALKPNLVFQHASDGSTFGTSSFHTFAIDADCEFYGQPIKLKAQKRFKTAYAHKSRTYSGTDEPMTLHWTSDYDFKVWDFICVDADQNPIAKYSANCWAMKKIGSIEFIGPKANTDAVREELLMMGLSLYYLMVLRTNSIFSLFGAVFSQPGRESKAERQALEKEEEERKMKKLSVEGPELAGQVQTT
ncbi:hypothetical protein P152DRAFT_462141 [Eremomyces bilateralis CBS 781.70]|uniref:Uncharacterized protein n=1 Tax=Eremomyces bilateralis CBS 781.70 TaxID=1392243 RepID=A0A6G1FSS6_9PEZI|nr:uncharacterized protein P152DRAFT_462141 [Eremomyces bilateralis CBS 781.70]KAF1808732.1 hypothetical protein P152DRAFT_462141 [Eremomyces bilateralis CBS 781.70]